MAPHPESKIKVTLGLKNRLGIASGLWVIPESVTSSDRHSKHQQCVTELYGLLMFAEHFLVLGNSLLCRSKFTMV